MTSDREGLIELAGRFMAALLSNPSVTREVPASRTVAALAAVAASAAREVLTALNKTTIK